MRPTINIEGVNITLTDDQLAEIDKQRGKTKDYKDIKSYADACKYFNIPCNINSTSADMIKLMCKAVNEIIGEKDEKFPNWINRDQRKYFPYFEYTAHGWGFGGSDCHCYGSDAGVGYFRTEEASGWAGKEWIKLYSNTLNNN